MTEILPVFTSPPEKLRAYPSAFPAIELLKYVIASPPLCDRTLRTLPINLTPKSPPLPLKTPLLKSTLPSIARTSVPVLVVVPTPTNLPAVFTNRFGTDEVPT